MKKQTLDLKTVGQIYLWCIILPQVLGLIFQLVVTAIASKSGATFESIINQTAVYLPYMMLAQIGFLVVLICGLRKHDIKKCLKLNFNIGLRNTIITIIITVVAYFAISPLVNLFNNLLANFNFTFSLDLPFEVNTIPMLLLLIFLMAFVPAIVEEFVFRGVILQGLKKYGKWIAILSTSVLFALIHFSLAQLIFPLLSSIIMCCVVLKTNSILPSMIIHFIVNSATILMSYFGCQLTFTLALWAEILIAIGFLVIGGLIIYLLIKLLKNVEPKTEETPSNTVIQKTQFSSALQQENNNAFTFKLAVTIGAILYILSAVIAFMPKT